MPGGTLWVEGREALDWKPATGLHPLGLGRGLGAEAK